MSTFSDLRQETFKGIETLASAFESLTRGWKLSSEFTGDILTPLQGSNWRGDAAERAAATITKTRNELDAAFEEAGAIGKALRDAHTELAAARADLDAALKRAADNSLTVDADGVNISWPAPTNEADKHDPDYATTYQALAKSVGQDIAKAVARAQAADTAAAAALGGATGQSKTAFQPSKGPEEQAKAAADLLKLAGNLSDAQLDQLNKTLKANANNPQFTTAFYQQVGPDNFLKFYGQLAVASADKGNRSTAVADLQKNLGTALATATDTHNFPHLSDEWEAGLRRAGATRVEILPGGNNRASGSVQPYGYQILANILRTGKYDPHFLNPVAEHVTQLAEMPGFFTSTPWMGSDVDRMKLLQGPEPGGLNPMSGVLDALAHNPEAATRFFHDRATIYNLDGSVKAYDQDNGYLKALTVGGDRSPLQDIVKGNDYLASGHAEKSGVLALGHALEAATTGRALDASPDAPLPQHTKEMGDVMNDVVNRFGNGDGPKLLHKGADFADLAPGLGNLTAAYMGDVQVALSPKDPELPTYGTPAELNKDNTLKFLGALGRNPDAYGAIAQAQQAYTTAHVQDVILHRDAYGAQFDTAVFNAAHPGGEVAGILTSARTDALVHEMKDDAKAYNDSIDKNVKWGRKVWDMTGGKLLAPIPGAVPVVNYLIDHATSSYYIKDVNTADAAMTSQNSGVGAAQDSVRTTVEQAAQGTGMNTQQIHALSTGVAYEVEKGAGYSSGIFAQAVNG